MWTKERIRDLRERYGETQAEFARRLGLTSHAVGFYEQGRGHPPGPVVKLQEILEREAQPKAEENVV